MSNITEKPQKLASALYLLTSFFEEKEPLKWKIRSLSSDLVSLGLYFKDNFVREGDQVGLEIRSLVREICALLNVARNIGLVSQANHEIINKELLSYLNILGVPTGLTESGGKMVLSSNFFIPESTMDSAEQIEAPKSEKDKIIQSDRPVEKKRIVERTSVPEKGHFLPTVDSMKKESTGNLKEFGAVSVKRNSRQSVIINLLKRKKEIMIKDVSPLINGCSEKTIQRELLRMVKAGILKKMGEKRWSKYTLA